MAIPVVLLLVFYCCLLILLLIGWHRASGKGYASGLVTHLRSTVSVVVAARNEVMGIGLLLDDLLQQEYAPLEIIVVDDHSDDGTAVIVSQYAEKDSRINLIKNLGAGKKDALATGIHLAAGTVIASTDGDCRVSPQWISGLLTAFKERPIKFVFGGVKMVGQSFFATLQSIEFMSLVGSGAAMSAWGRPTLCNGANLAFLKSVYEEVGGYEDNRHIPSGDDEFLMRKVLARYPDGITFSSDPRAVVSTKPNKTLQDFFYQRVRWAGKWKLHQSVRTKLLTLFIGCVQIACILLPFMVIRGALNLQLAMLLIGTKASLEFLLLWSVGNFLQVRWNWRAFILWQVIYPLYVLIIGLISNFSSFEWKGRKWTSLTAIRN